MINFLVMRLLFLIFLTCCFYTLNAQTIHVVQRGETFTSIASQYGISVEQLRNTNPLCEQCYVGLSLYIQKSNVNVIMEKKINREENGLYQNKYEEAVLLAASGELKKAIKVYDELIEENPNAKLYMNRGFCQFERGKWKRSISDFEIALSLNDLSNNERLETENYLKKAKENRNVQLENRANLWSGIAAMAVVTTATVVQASKDKKNNQVSQKSSNYSDEKSSEKINLEEETAVTKAKKECPICHGTGNVVEYTSNFGISEEKYCAECDKMVTSGHYHKSCSYCSGKGYR